MPKDEPVEAKPWEKQPKETSKAFHAFVHYRDLPPYSRSIAAANNDHILNCEHLCEGDECTDHPTFTKRAPRHWKGWSTDKNWVARVAAHDSELAMIRREKRAVDLERAQDDIASVSSATLSKIAQRLTTLAPDEIPVQQLASWTKLLSETLLRALGDEERSAIRVTGAEGGPVQVDQTVHVPDPETWSEIIRIREAIGDVEEEGAQGEGS